MPLDFGMIGIGGLGYLQAKAYADMEEVSIVAGADVSPDARSLFEDAFGAPAYEHYREMLGQHAGELDAVTVVTPHTLHYEHAMACLQRGLHVLVEKPMVTDVADAISLVDAATEQGLVLQVGYQRHFHPAFREIRRLLTEGRIGEVHTVSCQLGQDWIESHRGSWRVDPSLSGGGQLYDTGSHMLDVLLWVTGAEPQTVSAQLSFDAPRVDVNSALSIDLAGPDRPITASVGISGDGVEVTPWEGYVFWGTDGQLTYREDDIVVREKGGATYRTEIEDATDFDTLNERKLRNFMATIEGTEPPAAPGEVGVQVTALTEAAYRSAETDAEVAVQRLVEEAEARLD